MLKLREIHIPKENWFGAVVSRRKVTADPEFKRLQELVKQDRIDTIFVETHDRLGITKQSEFFAFLELLIEHDTHLFDLTKDRELTDEGIASELLSFIGVHASKEELEKTAHRSLRSRVNNFNDRGSWPTGSHPFGFGKECYDGDKLLWRWYPVSRTLGQAFYPDDKGKLNGGPKDVRIPGKKNYHNTNLIPTNNKRHLETVKLVFELFTKVGLSRRQISARMNEEGRTFYDKEFTFSYVQQILTNPAYVGDTHFGKTQTGELRTFDKDLLIVTLKKKMDTIQRPEAERIIKQNTHEGIVSRKVWNLTVQRLASEKERISYSPRNPAYYLKQIFVCGHCGKSMMGRTDIDHGTKKRRVFYVCTSYCQGKSSGIETKCGYHRINHDAAEQLLLDKIKEWKLEHDETSSDQVRQSVAAQIEKLDSASEDSDDQIADWIEQGVKSLVAYMKKSFKLNASKLEAIEMAARRHYRGRAEPFTRGKAKSDLPVSLSELKAAIKEAEAAEVETAKAQIAELEIGLKSYTLNWAKADETMQAILRDEIDRIKAQMNDWEQRTTPLAKRLAMLSDEDEQRQEDRTKLLKEWPSLDAREKGEALRRLFKTVTLFWDREFIERAGKPTRELKTDRAGRYRYTLQTEKIVWDLGTVHLSATR